MWRSPAAVAILVILASGFFRSGAAWGTTALVDAPRTEKTVDRESPFQEQSGEKLEQAVTGVLGRKGGAAEESSYTTKGNVVQEPRKKEIGWFGFLSPSKTTESNEATEGGDRASEELILEEVGESELGGEKASLEETEDFSTQQEGNSYVETGTESEAKSSERLGKENLLLEGGDATLDTPVETLETDDSNPDIETSESKDEESEAESENAEEEEEGKGWPTWKWFAKPKSVNSTKVMAKAPVLEAVTGRANSTEADSLVAEIADKESDGGEEEEGSEGAAADLDVEDSQETDDVEGERLADLRAVILGSVARAIKGGDADEAEKLLNDLFSQKREAANASSVAVLPVNSTSFTGAQRPSSAAALPESGTEEADESTESETTSPDIRTSVWNRLVGGQEEGSGGKTEGAPRAANNPDSEVVSTTRSTGFWGRLVGGGDKGNSNEAREELLAEPEGELMGAAGGSEKEEREESEEGLLRETDRERVGEVQVREGEEGKGSRKGAGGGFLDSVGNVDRSKSEAFREDGKGNLDSGEVEQLEGKSFGDTDEQREELDKEPALMKVKRVGLGSLNRAGDSELQAKGGDGQTLDWEEGEVEAVAGVDAPSALKVTTEVARLVPESDIATLNATRNATSFWNASGAAAHLVATVQAQTASLMKNITRLTPHAGWGIPVEDPAEEATDGILPVGFNASGVDTQSVSGQGQTQVDEEGLETGLARDPDLDEGLASKGGDSWSPFDEDDTPFSDSVFNLEAVQKQAQEHLVPHVQALSQATSNAYGSTHAQIRTTLDGVVGPKASGATATFIVMLLLLVPGVAVVVLCQKLKTVFSLQMVIFVCCAYLALHSAVLTLIALVYKDPLALFQRYSPGAYVMLQFVSLLAYVIFLALCTVSCATALRTGELLQRVLGAGQLLPAFGVGVHYFGAVWQPAMVDKPPHVSWTGYGVYTLAFMCICGVTWFRRSRHEVLASGGSAYKQM